MKKLFLIRHAQAEAGSFSQADFDRALTDRGIKEATATAEDICKKGTIPQLILTSTAKRALSTSKVFAAVSNIPPTSILLEEGIYEASVPKLLKIIQNLSDTKDCIALFGHNPGLSNVANKLIGKELISLSPSNGVLIGFESNSWKEITYDSGLLLDYFF